MANLADEMSGARLEFDEDLLPWVVAECLAAGADPNAPNSDGQTLPLILAVDLCREDLVERLLAAGADPWRAAPKWERVSAIGSCDCSSIARVFLRHGVEAGAFQSFVVRELVGADRIPERPVTLEEFDRAKHPREGRANPERVSEPFWEQMIRTGLSGASGHKTFGPGQRPDVLPAVWSHQRRMTTTELPDGRWVQIAGVTEEVYDVDSHVYNDVVVQDGQGGVRHFLYPQGVFPPTYGHTATYVAGAIWILGNHRRPWRTPSEETPVFRLDLRDFSIAAVATTGPSPGWIGEHRTLREAGSLVVEGGTIRSESGWAQFCGRARLDLATLTWTIEG